jgi:hypothetical protein
MQSELSKQRAMALLGIESSLDHDESMNQHEQKLFEWKQDVLQKYMVPSLLRSKLKLLDEFIQAEKMIVPEHQSQHAVIAEIQLQGSDRILMLENYETDVSKLKLQLMQASSFAQVPWLIEAFIQIQERFMSLFLSLFPEYSEALPEEVNSREMIDTGKLLLALKQQQIDNKMSWAIEREISRIRKIQGMR